MRVASHADRRVSRSAISESGVWNHAAAIVEPRETVSPVPSRRDFLRVGLHGLPRPGPRRLVPAPRLGRGQAGPRPPRRCGTASSIWLAGGPSHIDTFDPKPDAPADVRGEFKPIATSVPGLQISEVFPNLAKVMDQVTLIRSMTSPEADHDRASHHMLTGYRPSPALVYPSYGSVVSKVREATSRHAAALRRDPRRSVLRHRAAT